MASRDEGMKITINKLKSFYDKNWIIHLILLVLFSLVVGGVYWFHTEDSRNNDVSNVFWHTPREITFKVMDIGELKAKQGDYDTYLKLAFKNNKENLNDSIIYKKISYAESFNYNKGQVLNCNISYKELNKSYDCKHQLDKMKPSYTTSQNVLCVLGGIVVILAFALGCATINEGVNEYDNGIIAAGVVLITISVGLLLGGLLS